jgi:hypothetical protein
MPLNREHGEYASSIGPGHIVAPNRRWRSTRFFENASEQTIHAFRLIKYPRRPHFTDEDWMVQEYPVQGALCFFFCKVHRGQEFYHAAPFWLTSGVMGELMAVGLWKHLIVPNRGKGITRVPAEVLAGA